MTERITPEQMDRILYSFRLGADVAGELRHVWGSICDKLDEISDVNSELAQLAHQMYRIHTDVEEMNGQGITLVHKVMRGMGMEVEEEI